MAIKPNKANIPIIMQKGINLGYRSVLSNEIATERLNKFKRHSVPKLKKAAFANMKIGRITKDVFFITPPPFYVYYIIPLRKCKEKFAWLSGTRLRITPKACMKSATCCGMESMRSIAWNQHEVLYGINPKEDTRLRVMPYACGDSILTYGEITYQPFGLDKKIPSQLRWNFFVWSDLNRCHQFLG